MRRLRPHLTYANVMVTLLAIGALTGGVAYAANTIGSSDIINGEVKAADIGTGEVGRVEVLNDNVSGGGLTTDDIHSLTGDDIRDETLSGADIEDQSGVDTCTHSALRIGELCVLGNDHVSRDWFGALDQCASYGLRLPTLGEAVLLATNYDIPGVGQDKIFWTAEALNDPDDGQFLAYVANDLPLYSAVPVSNMARTLCVTTPTN